LFLVVTFFTCRHCPQANNVPESSDLPGFLKINALREIVAWAMTQNRQRDLPHRYSPNAIETIPHITLLADEAANTGRKGLDSLPNNSRLFGFARHEAERLRP